MTGRSGGGDDGFELLGRADHRPVVGHIRNHILQRRENMEADGRPGPEKQDVEESATHLFRVESSTPSRIDAFAIPIVYTASQLLQGSIAVPLSISRPLALLQSRIHLTSGIRKV